jgi:hypothetical protein
MYPTTLPYLYGDGDHAYMLQFFFAPIQFGLIRIAVVLHSPSTTTGYTL